MQGKINYLNINFQLLKTEGTQAFLDVLKMCLKRHCVRPDTRNPPFTTHKKIQSSLAEGREKGHLEENYFGDTALCLR